MADRADHPPARPVRAPADLRKPAEPDRPRESRGTVEEPSIMKLLLERSMFVAAALHALLFLLFGVLAVTGLGRPANLMFGLVLFLSLGLLAWRRAWTMRCERLASAT